MIPKVAQQGRSFKGAARYYLHDKNADTSERVAWTATLNLPTDDPRRAVAHMIDTATHANELKRAAGIKATGNKLKNPVYAYSIAWQPGQTPSQAEQMAAAKETIAALGFDKQQAIIVAHNDTAHPHVHVIVNKVDPVNGKSVELGNDFLKFSKWAESYERRHGKILCRERVENNAARERGQWRKDESPSRKEHYEWKKRTSEQVWSEFRREQAGAKDSQKLAYDAIFQQRNERMKRRKAELKSLYKPRWKTLFKDQKKDLASFDSSYLKRLRFAMKQDSRKGLRPQIEAIFSANTYLRMEFVRQQEERRRAFGREQLQDIRDAGREVDKAWKYDRAQLKEMFEAENSKRAQHYRDMSDTVWKGEKKSPENTNEFARAADSERPKRERDVSEKYKSESKPQVRTSEFARAADSERPEQARDISEKYRGETRRRRARGRTRKPER